MLSFDSPLRRLPPQLDVRQLVFCDGVRHAAEIADLAFERLLTTLTHIAIDVAPGPPSGGQSRHFTSAFLDAWAIVDALDRMRVLFGLFPGADVQDGQMRRPGFQDQMQSIRDLRNVADHVAQRVDEVIARRAAALGTLAWFTATSHDTGVSCAIYPGTLRSTTVKVVNACGRHFRTAPSGLVQLSAGGYEAELDYAIWAASRVVRRLEGTVQETIETNGLHGQTAGADLLLKVSMQFRGPFVCAATTGVEAGVRGPEAGAER